MILLFAEDSRHYRASMGISPTGTKSAAAVVVVFHAFHHTRNAFHSDRVS